MNPIDWICFAIGVVCGWTAHALENREETKEGILLP
jgi:citrate synthase